MWKSLEPGHRRVRCVNTDERQWNTVHQHYVPTAGGEVARHWCHTMSCSSPGNMKWTPGQGWHVQRGSGLQAEVAKAGCSQLDRRQWHAPPIAARGYVIPALVCLFVCLLATSHKNHWLDLREDYIRDVSMDKEALIKFYKSSATGSRSRNFWRILQHCEKGHFSTIGSYFWRKWLDLPENLC